MPRKLTEAEKTKAMKEAFKRARKAYESGSNEIRGKNQDAQKRAMWAKDPDADAIGGRD